MSRRMAGKAAVDYSNINLFHLMKTKMAYLSERQDILARNIANMDTPGYQPKDLRKLDFHRLASVEARRLKMRATHPTHVPAPKGSAGQFRDEEMRKTYETTPVENAVVLEEQMMKVAETQMQYQTVTNMYQKMREMFKTAIGN